MEIAAIRKYFVEQYPQQAQFFTAEALKSKVENLIELGLKRLFEYIHQRLAFNFPKLKRMDQNKLRTLIYDPQAKQAKLLILDIYSKEFNAQLVCQTIEAINSYL